MNEVLGHGHTGFGRLFVYQNISNPLTISKLLLIIKLPTLQLLISHLFAENQLQYAYFVN